MMLCGLVSLGPESFRLSSHPPTPNLARVPRESWVFPSQPSLPLILGMILTSELFQGEASEELMGWQSNISSVAWSKIAQIL